MAGPEIPQNKPIPFLAEVEPLLPRLPEGRAFKGQRKIRLGDVDPDGRLRFDGLTRYTQDVSNDDTTDARLPEAPGWVVRSTVVDELVPGCLGETLTFRTFCSALGRRWAERRLTVHGNQGARYEVATLWVCIDLDAGQPALLTEQFLDIYGSAAGGRKASARQRNPKIESLGERAGEVVAEAWQLRRADLDTLDHVNNAAYWAAVEEWMAPFGLPRRARVEYGRGLSPAPHVGIARYQTDDVLLLWWLEDGETTPSATASVVGLPSGLYRD